ncbi:MAG: methyltransferase domain-containing protein [Acidobacteriaceae bacterium]|jgi:SAM-dependent methyltransferase|nr:methyltransferase domain-containing protein [Acidobacteriaceae bacterium]
MSSSGVAAYYDRLTRWNGLARLVGYGGGSDALTVHRALADPRADGRPTRSRLHDVVSEMLAETLDGAAPPVVLDAGCGLGGTMLALSRRWGGRYVGVTLSPRQAAIARDVMAREGLSASIDVRLKSYDDPPAGPFDVVLAIESLVHSVAPETSLGALARVLADGGTLVIVDDMPEADAEGSAEGSADLAAFKRGWQCGALWTREAYLAAFRRHGLRLVAERDLTAECRPRSRSRIAWLMGLNRLVRLWPRQRLQLVMDSHHGGLALERLLGRRLIRYRLLMARKERATI